VIKLLLIYYDWILDPVIIKIFVLDYYYYYDQFQTGKQQQKQKIPLFKQIFKHLI